MQSIARPLASALQTTTEQVRRTNPAPLKSAAMRLASSACWGAAGCASVPFVALVPPLWSVPLYCSYRSASQLGHAVYESATLLSTAMTSWGHVIQQASALHANGRHEEAAIFLSTYAVRVQHAYTDREGASLRRLYGAAMTAYLYGQPDTVQIQRTLAALLEGRDESAFLRQFAALTPAQRETAACMSGQSQWSLRLLHTAFDNDAAGAFAALMAALTDNDVKFAIWRQELLRTFGDAGALFRRAIVARRPNIALSRIGDDANNAELFLHTFPQHTPCLQSLVQQHHCSAIDAIRWSQNGELALDLILTGQASLADVIALGSPPLTATVSAALSQDAAGAERLCMVGALTLEQALSLLDAGILAPQVIVDTFAVSASLVHQWWLAGLISLQAYCASLASTWRRNAPLAPEQLQWARSIAMAPGDPSPSARLNQLWNAFQRTNFSSSAVRSAFLARLTAVYLAADSAPVSRFSEESHECIVCFEPLTPDRPGKRTEHCEHSASICGACCRQHATQNLTAVCAAPHCSAHRSPNDLLALGVTADTVDSICVAALRQHTAGIPQWRQCASDGCWGGQSVAPGTEVHYGCPVCRQQRVLAVRILDRKKDLEYVRRLIAGLDQDGGINNVLRECYWCGSGTEHIEACAHMHCEHCNRGWDYNCGRLENATYNLRYQSYVPHAGLLLDAGLYEGLRAGSTGHADGAVRNHVRRRAEELGIIQHQGSSILRMLQCMPGQSSRSSS